MAKAPNLTGVPETKPCFTTRPHLSNMDTVLHLITAVPSVWHTLSGLQKSVVLLKAAADFGYCIVAPVVFTKQSMTIRTFTLVPLVAVCYVLSDASMFFSLQKSATTTQCYIAIGLLVYSIVFFMWAQYTMSSTPGLSAAFSDDEPQFLIKTGPWAFVRNPCYSAYLSSLLSAFILTNSSNHPDHEHSFLVAHAGGITLACFLVSLSIFWQAIRDEEAKFSTSKLRGQHDAYKRQVWALLPLADAMRR